MWLFILSKLLYAQDDGNIFPDLRTFYYNIGFTYLPPLGAGDKKSEEKDRKIHLGVATLFRGMSLSPNLGLYTEIFGYLPYGYKGEEKKYFVFKPSDDIQKVFAGGGFKLHVAYTYDFNDYFFASFTTGPGFHLNYYQEELKDWFKFHVSYDVGLQVFFGFKSFKIGLRGEGHYYFAAIKDAFSYSTSAFIWHTL